MERLEFLQKVGAVLVMLPAGYSVLSCDDEGDIEDFETQNFVSSTQAGHVHELTLSTLEVESAAPACLSRETSIDYDHSHIMVLSAEDLARLQEGEELVRFTTTENGHRHEFVLRWVGGDH